MAYDQLSEHHRAALGVDAPHDEEVCFVKRGETQRSDEDPSDSRVLMTRW